MGRPLCFTPVIYHLFFSHSNLPGQRMPPRGTFVRMSEYGVILQHRLEGALCIPLHFERWKSANFVSQLVDGATLDLCDLKTRLKIEKLKQIHLTMSLSKAPFTRYNLLSNRFENRLYHVYKHSTGCQTHLTTGLTTGCIVYTARCQTGCTTRFNNRLNEHWLFLQHGCQTGFDNRLNEQWLFI